MAAPLGVYCFADGMIEGGKLARYLGAKGALYVTPVFESEESLDLLTVTFRRSIPDAGFAVCVSTEDEPDISGAWQAFVDGARAQGEVVEIVPMPGQGVAPPPSN